jgi:beta propeller repeat protein
MKMGNRATICFVIFFVLFLTTIGSATAGSEQNPAIYEDRIVWTDDVNGNWDIHMYDISDSEETQITTTKSAYSPAIYGDRIVWEDNRNGNRDIYMYDLSTSKETRITTSESYQGKPAIYGDKIVWEDDRNGNMDIYMYDLSTSKETRITNNTLNQTSPAIYEDRIIWTEKGAIFLYNISTSTETQVVPYYWGWEGETESGAYYNRDPFIYGDRIVCEAESESGNYYVYVYDLSNSTSQTIGFTDEAYAPAIYEDRVVWENIPGGTPFSGDENHDIYMYNLSTSTETRITTNSSNQGDPAIYGDRIVWTDKRNVVTLEDMSDIYMYDLSTSTETRITTAKEDQMAEGTETRITTNEGEQEYPAIYGDRIVWRDWRNGNEHDFENGDIYMYDISTSTETRITSNESCQVNPAVYKDRIVWADDRNGGENWDIYMYNLSTKKETQITSNESYQFSPAIYGSRIVWQDYRYSSSISDIKSDIYMYDLSTQQETRITSSGSAYRPKIYEDRIVWQDGRNGSNIYMYDLSTQQETRITSSGSAEDPTIYGDRIIWKDYRDIKWDIYMYNLSTALETQISNTVGREDVYAIDDDRIVWYVDRGSLGGADIYMYNLSTATETRISNSGSATNPSIYGNRIVWQDDRNGNPDIYMFTLDSAEVPAPDDNDIPDDNGTPDDNDISDDNDIDEESDQPVANFSANVTSGYAPLSVLFTDLSQNATGRSWDFNNDGIADSTEKAPVYVFTDEGTYTVNFTAINENGTASKQVTITVSSAEEEQHSSSGGSRGGGGGGSPESARNVEVKELAQAFVKNGKEAKFDFTKNATCVVYVSFDSKKTAGKVTTIVEQLKNKVLLIKDR